MIIEMINVILISSICLAGLAIIKIIEYIREKLVL